MTDQVRPARTYRIRYIGGMGEHMEMVPIERDVDAEVHQVVGGVLFAFCMPKRIIPGLIEGTRTISDPAEVFAPPRIIQEPRVIWVHTLVIPLTRVIDCELIRDESDHSLSADEDVLKRYPALVS